MINRNTDRLQNTQIYIGFSGDRRHWGAGGQLPHCRRRRVSTVSDGLQYLGPDTARKWRTFGAFSSVSHGLQYLGPDAAHEWRIFGAVSSVSHGFAVYSSCFAFFAGGICLRRVCCILSWIQTASSFFRGRHPVSDGYAAFGGQIPPVVSIFFGQFPMSQTPSLLLPSGVSAIVLTFTKL